MTRLRIVPTGTFAKKRACVKIQRRWRSARKAKPATVKKVVKKELRNMEQMSYDQYITTASLSSTPSIITNFTNFTFKSEANDPPDRNELTQRTTQKVYLSTIRMAGVMNVSDDTNRIRLLLLRPKRSTQTANPFAADPTQVFNDVGSPAGSWLDSPINYRNVDCLWDCHFNLQTTVAGSTWHPYRAFKEVWTFKKELKYNLNTADNTDFPLDDQSYFMLGVSDSTVAPHPGGRMQFTVSFKNIGN